MSTALRHLLSESARPSKQHDLSWTPQGPHTNFPFSTSPAFGRLITSHQRGTTAPRLDGLIMEPAAILLLFLIALLVFLRLRRARRRSHLTDSQLTIRVSVNRDRPSEPEASNLGPLTPVGNKEWLLNPRSSFHLTICGVDSATAHEVKKCCDEKRFSGVDALKFELLPLIARTNLRCKEVDKYVADFKPTYLSRIREFQQASAEWGESSERDKADMMDSFREKAIKTLDVQPDCDLVALFEYEPKDEVLDDALIDRYGFETLQTYFRYSRDLRKIYQAPTEYKWMRADLEKLAECGLASRGKEIPLPLILETLKLKEMRELAADLDPPKWGRKAPAIEFLLGLPDIRERVGKRVAYRELFQLKPFLPEFSHMDAIQLSSSWRHAESIASLIARTYVGGSMCARDLFRDEKYRSRVTAWRWINDGTPCSYCKRIQEQRASFTERPGTPLHIGCRCWIEADYEYDVDS